MLAFGEIVGHETAIPKSAPTPAVAAIAKAPQNPTRAAPFHGEPAMFTHPLDLDALLEEVPGASAPARKAA